MVKALHSIQLVLIVVAVAALFPLVALRAASADSPTPTVPPATAVPSLVIVSPEPTVTLSPPTVTQEQSTPVVTAEAFATEPPLPTAVPAPTRGETHVVSTPTGTPIPVQGSTVPAYVPLPSPAELELNARLRWGTRVPPDVRRWAYLVVPAAHRYGLDPNLIAAVMTMESGGDPLAWNSGSDARGLMQILHGPWDPRKNVYTGARMLAEFLSEFNGDLRLALAAYNAGPNAVLQYGTVPPYRETRDYVIVVSYLYDLYSHRTLSSHRKAQYQSTLKDLQRFADQRKKIHTLESAAGISSVTLADACRHFSICNQPVEDRLFSTLDPFWPMGERPDPLQRVGPAAPGP